MQLASFLQPTSKVLPMAPHRMTDLDFLNDPFSLQVF